MIESFNDVCNALESSPEEAARMTIVSHLKMGMTKVVRRSRWNDTEGALQFHTTSERMDDLLRGRIDLFGLDELVSMAAAYGRKVCIEIETA